MIDRCRELRLRLWAGADEPEPELAAHLASCEACARIAARRARLGEVLGALPRAAVPAELEGSVVAALHAGQREERAVHALASFSRRRAPAELERRLGGELPAEPRWGLPAPSVLERLVDEDLRQPQRAQAERFLRKLERLEAPAALDARVAALLGAPQAKGAARPALGFAGAALAAALLVWAAAPWKLAPQPRPPEARISVVRARSLDQLGPTTRDLVDGLSGGLLSATEGVPR